MSFLKKLFGGGASRQADKPLAEIEHEGYRISAAPVREGSQYRVAGTISREIGGETKQHRLIRADLFGSAEEAAEATLRKAKQVIREQGDRLFG